MNEAHVSSSFTAGFLSFLAEIWQECWPIMWQKNHVGEFLFLASFESNDNVIKGNVLFIRT